MLATLPSGNVSGRGFVYRMRPLCCWLKRLKSHLFDRWRPGKKDATGNEAAPIVLLVLCALRYLGRGWTFDDLTENTAISEEVIRVFFHQFIVSSDPFYLAIASKSNIVDNKY